MSNKMCSFHPKQEIIMVLELSCQEPGQRPNTHPFLYHSITGTVMGRADLCTGKVSRLTGTTGLMKMLSGQLEFKAKVWNGDTEWESSAYGC